MNSDSDRLLVQQIRRGDDRAWDLLIERYEGRLLAFVERRLQDRAACEDVVQETFIGFLQSLPNYDEDRELQTYLFTIASYKLTDHLRRQGRHPLQHLSDHSSAGHEPADSRSAASSLARSRERKELESAAVARCLGGILRDWLERCDFLRVKVLELLLVKGWPNREVAAFLHIGEQQVANYRFAALKKLGELLRDAGLPAEVFPELRPPAR
jgi:RNA polymerase sigma-70 factor (ECF subfamily)